MTSGEAKSLGFLRCNTKAPGDKRNICKTELQQNENTFRFKGTPLRKWKHEPQSRKLHLQKMVSDLKKKNTYIQNMETTFII